MSILPKWLMLLLTVVVIAVLVYVLQPAPAVVDVAQVERRPFAETVDEQGRTRARDPYVITAPVSGRLLRSTLNEGDRVLLGQVIARIAPMPQDVRSLAFSEANLESAQARLSAATAGLDEARTTRQRATSELARREQLFSDGLISTEEIETYRQLEAAAAARLDSAAATLLTAQAEVESARSYLIGVGSGDANSAEDEIAQVLSPTNGTVYRVLEENERVIQAGTALFEISNEDALEVVVDLLTQDAVRVGPGDPIRISGWGGDRTINAVVQYIEPEAFTKISALGVEEQRVNVIGELLDPPPNLGAEYRVEASIVTWQGIDELTIPTSAIFQRSNGWNTFVVDDGETVLRQVLIGYRGRDYTQVIDGVEDGDTVVVYPSDLINEGTRVTF